MLTVHGGKMMRKLSFLVAVLGLLLVALPAAAAPAAAAPNSPDGKWGLLFNAKNLLSLDGFEDGYQAGAGVKYWAWPKMAVRGLIGVDHNTNSTGTYSLTIIGLGLAGEWHPKRAEVSPYLGPLLGGRMLAETNQTTKVDLYFGGMFGAEAKIMGPLWAFAEYDLVASFDINGFSVNLGTNGSGGGKAMIGIVVYF
jgi:hypothetical protein